MKKFLLLPAALALLALGGCITPNGTAGPGFGLAAPSDSAYYHCGQTGIGSASTWYHGLETRITNGSNVPVRVSGGLLNAVEIPPGGWVRDCVVTRGRSQAVQYVAVTVRPDRNGRYGTDSRSGQTGFEYGNINRTEWQIRF